MNLKRVFTNPKGNHFGMRIYRCSEKPTLKPDLKEIIFELRPSSLRFRSGQVNTFGDPFLIPQDGKLHCLFEVKNQGSKGALNATIVEGQGIGNCFVCDIGSKSHVSFPFIVNSQLSLKHLMIPETIAENEVSLYEAVDFPFLWNKKKLLLKGEFVDSHVFMYEENYFIFTTEKIWNPFSRIFDYRLLLYYSKELEGPFHPHPQNPIRWGRKYGRSGGPVLRLEEGLHRVSQDCSVTYGRELHFFRIVKLSPEYYEEELVVENWIERTLGHKHGGHHVSICEFNGMTYWALDLNFTDSYFQRFFNPFHR